jgi:hypothetical protein
VGVRKVRTARGESRYNKPIGAIIGRMGAGRARAKYAKVTGDVKRASSLADRALAGERLPLKDRDLIEYASPSARRKAVAERGSAVRPKRETVSAIRRDSRKLSHKVIQANPLSGKITVGREIGGRVPVKRASVARAKARKTKEYVGRRRRED